VAGPGDQPCALVKKTGSPLQKVFFHRLGTRRGSWRHGRGSPFVTNVTPPVSHGADQALARRANAFRQGSPREHRAFANPRYSTFFFFPVPCWFAQFIAARNFLCVVRWNLHRTTCRSSLTVVQLANICHTHELMILFLLFVGAQIAPLAGHA